MNDTLGLLLRRRHTYTWFVFGAFFLLIAYNWAGESGVLNIGPPILLVVIYIAIGQGAAILIAYLAEQSFYDPAMALFTATCKGGIMASVVTFLVHLGLLWLCTNYTWPWLPDFRSTTVVLIGSPIFPFMACLSATATLVGR
jgi:hypothetical protein